jgi:hypothetical protein
MTIYVCGGWRVCHKTSELVNIGGCQSRLTVLTPADAAECCPLLSREPLSADQASQVAPMPKALAEPVRLRLISLIAFRPGGEACVCVHPVNPAGRR